MAATRRWSNQVTKHSNAMDLEAGVFRKKTARAIALSVKRSAERSHRRKATPYRSALSMITFYLNRGGKGLSASRRKVIEQAKDELRRLFKRPPALSRRGSRRRRASGGAPRRTGPRG
jgi:hypothetical protein